MKTLRSSSIV